MDERKILVYGNSDKTEVGFPTEDDFKQFIHSGVFKKQNGRYRYSQSKSADIIVLSRDGKAYGHFVVDSLDEPTHRDFDEYPPTKVVYIILASVLYEKPVRLSTLEIKRFQFGKLISGANFQAIQELAGDLSSFGPKLHLLPSSIAGLEPLLREVQRRLGQSKFRLDLLRAYMSKCAVTGCNALEALEAAHIKPYSASQSNLTSNGLLLRAGIHTLFDKNLIGINPESGSVVLAQSLVNTEYQAWNYKTICHPIHSKDKPDKYSLEERWKVFESTQSLSPLT